MEPVGASLSEVFRWRVSGVRPWRRHSNPQVQIIFLLLQKYFPLMSSGDVFPWVSTLHLHNLPKKVSRHLKAKLALVCTGPSAKLNIAVDQDWKVMFDFLFFLFFNPLGVVSKKETLPQYVRLADRSSAGDAAGWPVHCLASVGCSRGQREAGGLLKCMFFLLPP